MCKGANDKLLATQLYSFLICSNCHTHRSAQSRTTSAAFSISTNFTEVSNCISKNKFQTESDNRHVENTYFT